MKTSDIHGANTNSISRTKEGALRQIQCDLLKKSRTLGILITPGFLIVFLILFLATSTLAVEQKRLFGSEGPWYEKADDGTLRLHLYFFWSKECPHCKRARPFLDELKQKTPWVIQHSLEITEHPQNAEQFDLMANALGNESRATPSWLFCGGMIQGFDKFENSGTKLVDLLNDCHKDLTAFLAPPRAMPTIPPASGPTKVISWQIPTALIITFIGIGWLVRRNRRLKKP